MKRLRLQGEEEALRFIGKQGSDEAHFIYAAGSQPMWMQTTAGRMAGMFGTWSMWAKDMLISSMRNATWGQRAAFMTRTSALSAAIGLVGHEVGVNMWNWIAPTGLAYAGGPWLDYVHDLREVISSPMDKRAAATKRLIRDVGSLSFPGQIFFRDVTAAMGERDDPKTQALSIFLGRPTKEPFAMTWLLDPGVPVEAQMDDLERMRWLDSPTGDTDDTFVTFNAAEQFPIMLQPDVRVKQTATRRRSNRVPPPTPAQAESFIQGDVSGAFDPNLLHQDQRP
jgi:hypothetical protein